MKNLSLRHRIAMIGSVAIATIFTGVTSAQAESVLAPLAEGDATQTRAIASSDIAAPASPQATSEELALTTDTSNTTAKLDTADLDLFEVSIVDSDTQAAIEQQPAEPLVQSNSVLESSPEAIIAQNTGTTQSTSASQVTALGSESQAPAADLTTADLTTTVTDPTTADLATLESDRRAVAATSDSADDLVEAQAAVESEPETSVAETDAGVRNNRIAQAIDPGRETRSGPSYIGVGGNIGLGGSTTLGEGSFAVISKIGLTERFSARPGVVIGGNDPVVLLPLTIDFPISSVAEAGELNVDAAPYIGGGIAISTGGDSVTRALVTAGVDIPVAERVTANAGVNFAFFDDTEIGIVVGVGYNF